MLAPGDMTWMLRPDLEVVRTDSLDGRPAFLVHDPLTGTFDRVEWPESDLVRMLRHPMRLEELQAGFCAVNTMRPTIQDIAGYVGELGKRGWLRGGAFWPMRYRERPRPGFVELLARLLFIQVPLLRPEHFLRVTAGLMRLLLNPLTILVLVACGAAGLYLALPRWEDYWRDSFDSFSLSHLPSFFLALAAIKLVHEFAHAYAATMAGARVTSMGIAFFFFMPLPFTDVTDAWRLPWRNRLRVASAGMLAEIAVAGIALLLWALSPPGEAAIALARLSSVAVGSTLLTNLNPGPRFDGYYVLVCLFRVENLRSRGMAELRRILWGLLFGIMLPDEEHGMGGRRRATMLLYACYAIFYRFSLGFALALMAYYMFPKAIGLPLAMVELWLFFGHPVVAEILRLRSHMDKIRLTASLVVCLLALAGFGAWFAGEWPRRITFPAVTRSSVEEAVRTQRSGVTASVAVGRGDWVERDQVLALLESPIDAPLQRRAEWSLRESEISEEQAWRADPSKRDTAARAAETNRRRVELEALRQRADFLAVTAPAAGVLSAWDDTNGPGVPTPRGKLLGWITRGPVVALSCYPDIETAGRLETGGEVVFFPDDGSGKIAGRIIRIDESRPEVLEDAPLAAALGAVRSGGRYMLPKPYAKVDVRLDAEFPRIGQTGTVWVWSKPESLATRTYNWLRELAVRESAF